MSGTILLRQKEVEVHVESQFCGIFFCNETPKVEGMQWNYINPTADMEAKGLTPAVLREILSYMNEKSKRDFFAHWTPIHPLMKCAPFIGMLLGVIIIIIPDVVWMIAIAFFGPSLLALYGLHVVFYHTFSFAASQCSDSMQEYVDVKLNEQWEKAMIRWAWNVETIRGYKGRISHQYHIEITSMLPQNVQMVQIPMQQVAGQQVMIQQVGGQQIQGHQLIPVQQVIQQIPGQQVVGQQGVPVQYVVVQNPNPQDQAPPPYQTQAPPQYETQAPPDYEGNGGYAPTMQ